MRTESVFFNSDIAHTVKQLIPVIVSALEYLAWNNKWHSFFNNSFSLRPFQVLCKRLKLI